MSWKSIQANWNKVQKSSLGTFWDTHIGREGLLGAGGELLGLGPSGTTRDMMRREKGRLGSYIEGVEGREQPIKDYYGALQAMQGKDFDVRKKQMDYGARVEGDSVRKGYAGARGQMGFAQHFGSAADESEALSASALKYGSERTALDLSASMAQMRTGKAKSTELQGLTDMIWQLNEQYRAI